MEEKIEQICNLAHDLVVNHNMKQRDIYKRITKYLVDKTCNKKQYILYNAVYGGFSFSTEFREFTGIYEQRKGMRDDVIAFGKKLAEQYPRIARMVAHYFAGDLKRKTNDAASYQYWTKTKHYLVTNIETLKAMSSQSPLYIKPQYAYTYIYTDEYVDDDMFATDESNNTTAAALITQLVARLDEVDKQIAEFEDIDTNILAFLSTDATTERDSEMTFLDSIKQYGENSEVIWMHQSHLDKLAMRYLAFNTPETEIVPDEQIYETLGLMGASGKYACLQFAKVPMGLSWRIREYDGDETVVVD